MYLKNPQVGKGSSFGFAGSARPKREPYRMRAKKPREKGADKYAYLDAHSGKYDAIERRILKDPYADGWERFETGRAMLPIPFGKCWPKGIIAEFTRLFTLGFNDAEKLTQKKGV